jgi:hypothetical protein
MKTIEEWLAAAQAALANGSAAAIAALLEEPFSGVPADVLLALLQRLAALLGNDLPALVDPSGTHIGEIRGLLNGWTGYVDFRLWELGQAWDQATADQLHMDLSAWWSAIGSAKAGQDLSLAVLGSPTSVPVSRDALEVLTEIYAGHMLALEHALEDAAGARRPSPSARRP